ncbi:TPA: long-chain-fatty-acid--CoA ligase [Escherichia coli]|uniref:fatty acyl-CoA synthetase n=1 Tax=Pseudomonadota TaxID=1224 RepID=UPI00287C19E0|nr:long-chain-fatty-acid--CoA ligase [Escherichia coli]HEA1240610.1 long-chain-fatty-acid--CoA ligase [Escherichia coli]HEA1932957.1 long-chain-fatty-acid--CoA ligase [Escherichia coli]HEA2340378.1 long-chain-fatty-acid--CoA ligase [Escherichia coli]
MDLLNDTIRRARRHTLGDVLRRSARRYPDKLAVKFGDTSWTYREYDELCSRLASGLVAQGIATGDRVAILARNSNAFVALRFAAARLGAVFVPINFMLTAREVGFILGNSGAKTLYFDSECQAVALEAATAAGITAVWCPNAEQAAGLQAPPRCRTFDDVLAQGDAPVDGDLDDTLPAQIIYTSGTESHPKGAVLTHAAVIAEYVTCNVDNEVQADDRLLHALPLFHCAQLDVFFGPAVHAGASSVITSQATPVNILAKIRKEGITSFFAPPTVWIALLRSPEFDSAAFAQVTKGYYGASIMPVEVLKELQRRLPGLRLWNLYGQTEIAPMASVLKPQDQLRKAGSAGRPVINVETRLVDDAMKDVAVGEIGEIVHRSPQLMTGYFGDPARTAEAFQGGWFHSGDLGYRDEEGYLYVVDRKKDMIKTGGENVASREVEEFLYGIDGVAEVAVVGVSHPEWVEEVVAVIVRKPDSRLTVDDVLAACRQGLARYKTPKRVVFQDALPKNPSGKLLKRDLRLQLASESVLPDTSSASRIE